MAGDDRTDPRTVSTDKKITAAALALLREGGPQRVTIEAVSAASGVAKTSIYRRYANSLEMLEGALGHAGSTYTPQRPAAPANWEDGLAEALHFLLQDMGIGVAVSLLSDPLSETSRILREHLVRPRVERLRELLVAEIAAGRLSADLDVDVVLDFVLGSAYSHVARYGELGEDWPARVHRTLTGVLGAHRS
ncbi:TetR/AcrR family transcriptional regulator [Kocuria sp.]|jgi:AcrR family transcriptional regulator|uniref:TetR/AcrR family transcriptional regulator n=1 Tax=Kocuria sp. TaxID=1871328 RepID=UPI002812071E|nr:TetR/AcrR family transcriptional regulator [Kocuria sp.]